MTLVFLSIFLHAYVFERTCANSNFAVCSTSRPCILLRIMSTAAFLAHYSHRDVHSGVGWKEVIIISQGGMFAEALIVINLLIILIWFENSNVHFLAEQLLLVLCRRQSRLSIYYLIHLEGRGDRWIGGCNFNRVLFVLMTKYKSLRFMDVYLVVIAGRSKSWLSHSCRNFFLMIEGRCCTILFNWSHWIDLLLPRTTWKHSLTCIQRYLVFYNGCDCYHGFVVVLDVCGVNFWALLLIIILFIYLLNIKLNAFHFSVYGVKAAHWQEWSL